MDLHADLVIRNGRVITVNKNDDIEEAIAIRENKIVFVGRNEDVEKYIAASTQIIDARGRSLSPGIIDSHQHFLTYGLLNNGIVNITYPALKSIGEIKEVIRKEASIKKKGEWIKLQGYDHNKLEEGRHPTRYELDEVAPENPVQCVRVCVHMGVYNSRALEIGGIESESQYDRGEVVVDENGVPTGLLKETAHMEVSKKVLLTDGEILSGLKNADGIMLENGITSVHDAGSYGKDVFRMMQYASENGYVKVRMRPMIFDLFGKKSNEKLIRSFIETGIYTNLGDEKYSIGPAKIMVDGSSSGPSSAMLEPYSHDPTSSGLLVWTQEEADEVLYDAHKAGYQVTAHAVGDQAVTIVVNAIEKALERSPKEDHRHRIDHCGIVNDELLDRIASLGIIPVSNPAFITINGRDYNKYYGGRVKYMFPLKSYMEKGIVTTLASDAPVTVPNPMYSLYGALTRKDYLNQVAVAEGQRIEILDAMRMFTINAAYASFEEDIKGSLEVGKLGDITIFSENLLDYPREDLFDVKVDYTIIDGKIQYERAKGE